MADYVEPVFYTDEDGTEYQWNTQNLVVLAGGEDYAKRYTALDVENIAKFLEVRDNGNPESLSKRELRTLAETIEIDFLDVLDTTEANTPERVYAIAELRESTADLIDHWGYSPEEIKLYVGIHTYRTILKTKESNS